MWASVPYHSHYYYKDFHLFNIKTFFIFGCIFYLVSFIRQRIKQERKKVTAYCEVDNIRCKFDKCSKFVWGVLMHYFKGWFIASSLFDGIRNFQTNCSMAYEFVGRTGRSLLPIQVGFNSFLSKYSLYIRCYDCWFLYLLFLMLFLQLKDETQGNERYSKYFHLNTC